MCDNLYINNDANLITRGHLEYWEKQQGPTVGTFKISLQTGEERGNRKRVFFTSRALLSVVAYTPCLTQIIIHLFCVALK